MSTCLYKIGDCKTEVLLTCVDDNVRQKCYACHMCMDDNAETKPDYEQLHSRIYEGTSCSDKPLTYNTPMVTYNTPMATYNTPMVTYNTPMATYSSTHAHTLVHITTH